MPPVMPPPPELPPLMPPLELILMAQPPRMTAARSVTALAQVRVWIEIFWLIEFIAAPP